MIETAQTYSLNDIMTRKPLAERELIESLRAEIRRRPTATCMTKKHPLPLTVDQFHPIVQVGGTYKIEIGHGERGTWTFAVACCVGTPEYDCVWTIARTQDDKRSVQVTAIERVVPVDPEGDEE